MTCGNPFERLAIAREGQDATRRLPFSRDELQRIGAACHEKDDDMRWAVAILIASGARLGEVIGLRRADVCLDHEVPHIQIRPYEALGRHLKTRGSERLCPLLPLGLWASRQPLAAGNGGSGWLFGRYAADGDIRAAQASNAINKWIRKLGIPRTIHSARHSMKDALRNSGCSEELAKSLLGHGSRSVADSYGTGFSLQRLAEALERTVLTG